MCSHTYRPFGLPIYVARVPRGSIRSLLPSQLYLDHSHCLDARASYPSCVAVYPRDVPVARVLCLARRSLGEGGSLFPFAPLLGGETRAKVGLMGHNKGRDNARKRAKRRKKNER